jgi:GT2 family glycosyltransferase
VGRAASSVIVCAYTEERWQDLLEAVDSVKAQVGGPCELIVVIDHNPALYQRASQSFADLDFKAKVFKAKDFEAKDFEAKDFEAKVFEDVRVLENAQERGLSGARNTGIAAAKGEIVVFMDEDAAAEPGWLDCLLSAYRGPAVLGVGGAIEPWWQGPRPAWFPAEFLWVVGCTYKGMPEHTAPVRNLIGANMSMRRALFEQVGGFVNGMGRVGTLPVGCEETELCIRAGQHNQGGHFLYEPRARVRHRVPAHRATWRYFFSRCFAEGISKAQVARLVGTSAGLASERAYTLRVLPLGFLRGLRDGVLRRDPGGFGRAFAIAAGLLVTTLGYLRGKLTGGAR